MGAVQVAVGKAEDVGGWKVVVVHVWVEVEFLTFECWGEWIHFVLLVRWMAAYGLFNLDLVGGRR